MYKKRKTTLRPKIYEQLITDGRRRIILFMMNTLIDYPMESDQFWNYIYTNIKWIQWIVFIYLCIHIIHKHIHTCTHASNITIIIKENGGYQSEGEDMEKVKGEKGGRKVVQFHLN